MKVLVSAILFCLPVALFANDMEKVNVKADQNYTNVVTTDDFNQANNDQINLDEGATDEWRGGRGYWRGGRGYWGGLGGWWGGYGGYGWNNWWPSYSWLYPSYWGWGGWGW